MEKISYESEKLKEQVEGNFRQTFQALQIV